MRAIPRRVQLGFVAASYAAVVIFRAFSFLNATCSMRDIRRMSPRPAECTRSGICCWRCSSRAHCWCLRFCWCSSPPAPRSHLGLLLHSRSEFRAGFAGLRLLIPIGSLALHAGRSGVQPGRGALPNAEAPHLIRAAGRRLDPGRRRLRVRILRTGPSSLTISSLC